MNWPKMKHQRKQWRQTKEESNKKYKVQKQATTKKEIKDKGVVESTKQKMRSEGSDKEEVQFEEKPKRKRKI